MLLPQVLRGCSLMLCKVPINNVALGTLPPQRIQNASGLYNLTRNLGGAVGLAIINTMLTQRSDAHYARLSEHVTTANPRRLTGSTTLRATITHTVWTARQLL